MESRSAGYSTCPICERHWLVTPEDDCMMPACGHFGFDPGDGNPARPCHSCGTAHAWRCRALGNNPEDPLPARHVTIDLREN